jgi:TRAP-type C4-dicarboxylate transport system substrate-binding protein
MRVRLPLLLALLSLVATVADARPLRIATIVPSGSSWMKELQGWGRTLKARSKGQLTLRIAGGATMGDERDVVRKMDRGDLDGAAATSVGLGLLLPAVRVLELPLLFENTAELDHVRGAITPELAEGLKQRGYLFLGWGDLGWVSLYSTAEIRSIADLKRVKIWSWTDDPVARSLIRRLGPRAVPLAVQDVLPALQTGLIDTCYGTPYTMLALQWHTKIRHLSQRPLTYAVGAIVITRRAFAKLTPREQQILVAESSTMTRRFVQRAREDNARALAQLKKLGIRENAIPADVLGLLRRESAGLWNELAGKLYSKQLLARVLRLRDEARRKR